MLHLIYGLIGLATLGLVLLDLLWTMFLEGAGPLTKRICSWVGRVVLVAQGRCTTRRIITKSGLLTVTATMLCWSLLLWLSWALIFSADPNSISATFPAAVEPSFWNRMFFVGCNISTLGTGDFRPNGKFWEFATVLTGGSGFLMLGVAIAYVVPVVTAATQKRQVALNIWSLGKSPVDIISRAWNGADTTALVPHLVSLSSMLALLGESHLTYPVLHYFHSSKRSSAIAPNVAALDEALTILECGLQRGCSLDVPALGAARESITEFLSTLRPALIQPATADPPEPSLASLREIAVPVVDDALFKSALASLAERRRLLLTLVHNEGWTWESVWPANPD
ncbi:MAG TPA: ion channel [Tepidisphaeraceae bacterium]|jgi:hypothetical protein|nr:ion channel [Tepidisphaeraceae bacterium]